MSAHRPPRLAEKLLRAALPARVREEVLGDLQERYQRYPSRLLYWRATVACLLRLPLERARGRLRSATPLLTSLAERKAPPGSDTQHPRRSSTMIDSLVQDLRYALRTLLKAPGFTSAAVLTIALAVGANTALFSVVWNVVYAPLPYEEPEELVHVWGALTARDVDRFNSSFPMLREIRETADAFEAVEAVVTTDMGLTSPGRDPEQVTVGWATDGLFAMLGVRPAIGRGFRPEDAAPGGPRVPLVNQEISEPRAMLLSWETWQARYGGSRQIVGDSVLLDGRSVQVVGVLPEGFRPMIADVPEDVDLWVALRPDYGEAPLANVLLDIVARLRPDAVPVEARASLDRAAEKIRALNDVLVTAGFELRMAPLGEDLSADARPALLTLMGAVAFVLLIACANVSNLLLVRATTRRREMAVRSALGGGRGRLIRQMATESLVLGLAGGVAGLGLASLGLDALMAMRGVDLPRADEVALDGTALAFSLGASLLAALLFGTLPALQASRPAVMEALKSRGTAGGGGRSWTRDAAVLAQIVLGIVLLVGAGLMVRSFLALHRVDPGFEPAGLLTFTLDVPAARYPDPAERHEVLLRLQDRIEAVAGVESASSVLPLPLRDGNFWGRYGTEDAAGDPSRFKQANYRVVLPGYLETMGTRLVAGRTLTRADYRDAAPYVLVDDVLAERTWPGESPLGKRLLVRPATPEPVTVEVVGLVENQRHATLAERGRETIYFPTSAFPVDMPDRWVVRTGMEDPAALLPELQRAVAEIDPVLPVAEAATMEQLVDDARAGARFALSLIGLFGVMALVMAAVGLYGVLAYAVRQRRPEMGLRLALGARPADVGWMVVGQGVRLAGVGVAVGLVAALAASRAMAALLVGVSPTDPLTFGAIGVFFLAVAAVASWLPARRAGRTDPLDALTPD